MSHMLLALRTLWRPHLFCKIPFRIIHPGTIHLVVVDPGVGTERAPVAMRYQDQLFVGTR